MKRVVSLVAALALAVGAFAPAAFASDAGYGQTDLIPLEDLDQETFDTYLAKFYSQDYPTYGVLDLIRDTFEGGLANASGLNDSSWSWALNLVDNVSDLGTEIGLWMTGVKIDPNTGKAIYPDDYLTDYAKSQLDSQLKTTGTTINGHHWEKAPASWSLRGDYGNYTYNVSSGNGNIYYTTYGYSSVNFARGVVLCSVDPYTSAQVGFAINRSFSGSLRSGYYAFSQNANSAYGVVSCSGGFSTYEYASYSDALADFFGQPIVDGSSWNGSGYYSEHQDSFSINLPSLPSTNWGNLSKYYYTTYGDEIYEGNIDRYYYNIANNYVPYEVSYDLPYWLINGSTDILTFDYSLELPTAELSTLPSDFQGGSNFWDNSFSMLAGFGSFIVLGLSFALVGLFFKD